MDTLCIASFLDTLQKWDADLLLTLNGQHAPFWDPFMYLYSDKMTWAFMYAVLVLVLLRNMGWKRFLLLAVFIALTITLADQTSSSLIRHQVARLRPANLENPLSSLVHIVNGYRGGRYGFPSSHAANSFALVAFLSLLFKRKGMTVYLVLWALLNCYSRIYLGVHYPGDILVGSILGLLVGSFTFWLCRKAFTRVGWSCEVEVPLVWGSFPCLAWIATMAALLAWSACQTFWLIPAAA